MKSPAFEDTSRSISIHGSHPIEHVNLGAHHVDGGGQFSGMIGQSDCMQALFAQIRRVAAMDISILVHGETGTGKELVARALHELSGRTGKFIAVNSGAIAPELLCSQLFGHERGSFTGAMQSHAGYFEQARGGTLFLDEITEMPQSMQVYLLRVIETRTLTRVGGLCEIPVDVRVIAASNRDPKHAVTSGHLRSDLYFRLMEFPLIVPPLRDRRDDITLLAQHFLDRLNARYGTAKYFDSETLRTLCEDTWPGNVRELLHAVQRLFITADEKSRVEFQPGKRPMPTASASASDEGTIRFNVGVTMDEVEREVLLKTLAHFTFNRRRTAQALGITTRTIHNRLSRYRAQNLIGDDALCEPGEENGR